MTEKHALKRQITVLIKTNFDCFSRFNFYIKVFGKNKIENRKAYKLAEVTIAQ